MTQHNGILLEVREKLVEAHNSNLLGDGFYSQTLTKLDAFIAAVPDDLGLRLRGLEGIYFTKVEHRVVDPIKTAAKLLHDGVSKDE